MLVMLASHASECSTKGTEVKRKQKQEMDWQLANLLQKRQDWQHDADVVRGLAIDRQVKRKRGFIDAFEGCSARVRQFKPYILKQVTWYAYHYKIQHRILLVSALKIAKEADRTFDPSKAKSFATHLGWRLQRLHRIAQRHLRAIYGPPEDWSDWEEPIRFSDRAEARWAVGKGDQYRIDWEEQKPHLQKLVGLNTLRERDRIVLNWMLDPKGQTMTEMAAANGIPKGSASRIRYRLLRRAIK
jgi:hypothetical protein